MFLFGEIHAEVLGVKVHGIYNLLSNGSAKIHVLSMWRKKNVAKCWQLVSLGEMYVGVQWNFSVSLTFFKIKI